MTQSCNAERAVLAGNNSLIVEFTPEDSKWIQDKLSRTRNRLFKKDISKAIVDLCRSIPDKEEERVKWTTESMREALLKKPSWRWSAFIRLAENTVPFSARDGVGFNRFHRHEMMQAYHTYKRDKNLPPHLRKMIDVVIPKYARQLAKAANEKRSIKKSS